MIATQFNNLHLCLKPLTLLHNISGTFIFICLFYDKFQCHESEHTQVLDVADVITNMKKRIGKYKHKRLQIRKARRRLQATAATEQPMTVPSVRLQLIR